MRRDRSDKIPGIKAAIDSLNRNLDVLFAQMQSIRNELTDIRTRVHDTQDDIQDVKTRMHDSQDALQDVMARVHDTQDAAHKLQSVQIDPQKLLRTKPTNSGILNSVKSGNQILQLMFFYDIAMREKKSLNEVRRAWFRNLPSADGMLRKSQLAVLVLLRELNRVCRERSIEYWIDFGTLLGAVRHGGFIPWDDDADVCMMRGEFNRLKEAFANNRDFYISELYLHSPSNSINHICQLKFKADDKFNMPYCLDIFLYDYCDSAHFAQEITNKYRQEYQDRAWRWYRKANVGFPDDLNNPCQEKIKSIFEEFLQMAYSEAHLSQNPRKDMVWAVDNFAAPNSFQSNGPTSDVFPLSEIEFENEMLYAPRLYHERLECKYGDYLLLPFDLTNHRHYDFDDKIQQGLNHVISEFYSDHGGDHC